MAQTDDLVAEGEAPERKRKRRWAKRIGWLIAIILAPLALAAGFLSSPIGKRWVADQIAEVAPASGLRFEVGRIEGDIYGSAVLHDVTVKDPQGAFLTIPEVGLDWRPLSWLWSGIDIRELSARRATLTRLPELLPGDPDAPILPDFDIRIDRLEIDNLMLAKGVAGETAQRVDFYAKVDIRSGRALIDAEGTLGPEDRIDLLLDAEPDGDRFDLALDYYAAADGPTAALAGLDSAYTGKIEGQGTWSRWLGHGLVNREVESGASERVAGFRLTNDAGEYGILGLITPRLRENSLAARVIADGLSLAVTGTLEGSVFDGNVAAVTGSLDVRAEGAIDLADNRVNGIETSTRLRDPDLLGEIARLESARMTATLDGPLRDLAIDHTLIAQRLVSGEVVTIEQLEQSGTATYSGETLMVPLNLTAARVVTGNDLLDTRLENGRLTGVLSYTGSNLDADNARLEFPDLQAKLTLRGDLVNMVFALAGPVTARGLEIESVGSVTVDARLLSRFGSRIAWNVNADITGRIGSVANATIANLAGEELRFTGALAMGPQRPIELRDVELTGEQLSARFDTRIEGGETALIGSGEHARYGPFGFDARITADGPRAQLQFASPLPAAGLSNVRLGIAPSGDGFAIDAKGGSLLGAFDGAFGLVIPDVGPTRIAVDRLRVHRTNVRGALALDNEGISGDLSLSGGGLGGTIGLSPERGGAQAFELDLTARQASFGGDTRLALAFADISASGAFDGTTSRIEGKIEGSGFEYGQLSIAAFSATGNVVDGRGAVQASIAGRRADRFALKLDGQFAPERIALIAQGEYGGSPISMPRRAVLTALEGGGYRLAPAQIGYARGYAIIEGTLGGEETALEAQLARMPLRLADLVGSELGLGGRLSGLVSWKQRGDAPPSANARVKVENFTRSGLVLSSRPINLFAVADLSPRELVLGARVLEEEERLGRLDARISRLLRSGDLNTRIMRGALDAQLQFDGPAQSLWRLAAIETFDLTGPVSIEAKATGTLANPRINGVLASDDLRLQSAISGTDITDITARGRFAGSRLELTRFAGETRGGGKVSGSGSVDLAGMSASRGPQIDIRAAASRARLLGANGLVATISGPLRVVSNGSGGAIAGRVTVDSASWRLGVAAEDMSLPVISTREINRRDMIADERRTAGGSWRYLVDARAPRGVAVDGMGLASEWGIDIALRGTVDDPRIGGEARLVRGAYTFAGTRFDLTDGRIEFDASVPIDPRLDIEAAASANGTDVTIDITGNAQTPQIAFSSSPALPEEEILARLLFGGSVTSLSATDAVQLAAALAALQGGGGLDPIGQLRRSIGLDQLRIVSADPALGRGTGVALGKNIGRRVYVELVTDGQGYSATQVEYRITSWLSLLGSVTTIGRDSVLAEISRDY